MLKQILVSLSERAIGLHEQIEEGIALLHRALPMRRTGRYQIEAVIGNYGHKPFSVVGGGDTVSYIQSRNMTDLFSHVSTGGGASLELMAGKKLPGIEALRDKS